jgi:hypothetical protein
VINGDVGLDDPGREFDQCRIFFFGHEVLSISGGHIFLHGYLHPHGTTRLNTAILGEKPKRAGRLCAVVIKTGRKRRSACPVTLSSL